jgi:hypothetical protein
MVVIFGFGRGKQEDLGEIAPGMCPNCHNQVYLHHVRSKKAVRLYFVPVVPYGTDNYLVCPICSRGLNISHAQLPRVHSMSAAATASFRAGRLPEARYIAQVELFWRQLGVNPAGQQILSRASPGTAPTPASSPAQPATPAQPPSEAADDENPWISQLAELARLHNQGILSDAHYAAAKRRILDER